MTLPGPSGGNNTPGANPNTSVNMDTTSGDNSTASQKLYSDVSKTAVISRTNAKTYFTTFDFSKNTHSYRISRPPPIGFSDFISNRFKSVRLIDTRMTVILQKFSPTLMMHFDEKASTFTDDFENAKEFTIKIGANTISLKAVPKDETDGHGTVQPRIVKNIFCSNVAPALAANPEILKTALADYADIDIEKIDVICSNEIYTGQIVVPVNQYKKIPPRTFEVPYATHDGKIIENVKDQITLNCRGVNFDQPGLLVEKNKPPYCGYCKGNGHWTGQCKNRPRKCPKCGNEGPECTRRICAFADKIAVNGEFPARSVRKPAVIVSSDDESSTYVEETGNTQNRVRSQSLVSASSRSKRKRAKKSGGRTRTNNFFNQNRGYWNQNPEKTNGFGISMNYLSNLSNNNRAPLPQRHNPLNQTPTQTSNSFSALDQSESSSQATVNEKNNDTRGQQ